MKTKVTDELKQHFRPEFLNRVDDVIVFHQLTPEEIVRIVDLMITQVDIRLHDKDMGLELTQAAKELLAEHGFDPVLGARPLRRTIQREIEDSLSEKILFGELKAGEIVVVDVEGEGREANFTFVGSPKSELPEVEPVVEAAQGRGRRSGAVGAAERPAKRADLAPPPRVRSQVMRHAGRRRNMLVVGLVVDAGAPHVEARTGVTMTDDLAAYRAAAVLYDAGDAIGAARELEPLLADDFDAEVGPRAGRPGVLPLCSAAPGRGRIQTAGRARPE